MKIEIEIDMENKMIKKIDIPTEINPVEVVGILNSVENTILTNLKIETKNKIIQPKKTIIGV